MTVQKIMPSFSQLDIAPTVALILGLHLPSSDGRPIDFAAELDCKNVALIIIDSLGYDLLMWLLPVLDNMKALSIRRALFAQRPFPITPLRPSPAS